MKALFVLSLSFLLSFSLFSQKQVQGTIYNENGEKTVYAHIYIPGTNTGVYSDENGAYKIEIPDEAKSLVCSYVGHVNDTISISEIKKGQYDFHLKSLAFLNEFEVESRRSSTTISAIDPLKVENMDEKELRKAACCNLSESFETNPSIDLAFTDAVTGTRTIMMLGLAGKYTLTSAELIPDARVLGTNIGLAIVPGPWVESIQVSKGSGSVQNGTESLTGQINYELKKPEDCEEKIFLNTYTNNSGRFEVNAIARQKIGENLSTSIMAHANTRRMKWDVNKNGFLDAPLQDQINLMNRWKFDNGKNFEGMAGLWFVHDEKNGGQLDYQRNQEVNTQMPYGISLKTRKISAWTKFGFLFENGHNRSLGFQLNYTGYLQNADIGLNHYNGRSNSYFANVLFQEELFGENLLKFGFSSTVDLVDEYVFKSRYERNEVIMGPHVEYNYNVTEKFSLLGGARYDMHNQFGGIFTPRLHLKWDSWQRGVFRASVGRGSRTASIFNENLSFLATARTWNIESENGRDTPYGLGRESSWNYGINFTQNFTLDYREGFFTVDVYRLEFENQIVVDLDQAANQLYMYNLEGVSYSNSVQATIDYELIKFLDLRLAYRYVDVQSDYKHGRARNPLVPAHRGFANIAYETRKNKKDGQWLFDLTAQWSGVQRLPGGFSYREANENQESPAFWLFNSQVTRRFNSKFESYLGVENITGFRQMNPILGAENPFSDGFDATQIWGPIFGRMVYIGFRYSI